MKINPLIHIIKTKPIARESIELHDEKVVED